MNRFLKWLGMLLAGFVLLLVLAALLLPIFIDPNNYRDDISKLVYDQTGLTLSINGPISWSVFPWLGLSIEKLSVVGIDNNKLAELSSVEVSVKLFPLIKKRVEIKTASLAGLKLDLVRNKNGVGNWVVNLPKSTRPAESKVDTDITQKSTKKSAVPEIAIGGIKVTDLSIRYEDKVSGNLYNISQASFKTGAIANRKPFDVNVTAIILSKVPDINLKTSLSAKLSFNLTDGIYDADNLSITINPNIVSAESLVLKGDLHLQQEPLLIKGQLNSSNFNPRKLLSQINIQLPVMGGEKALESLVFNSDFQSDGKSLDVSKLGVVLDDFSINGFLKVADFKQQDMEFTFNGSHLNLDNYLPVSTNNEAVSPKAEGESSVSVKEQPLIPEDILRNLNINGSLSLLSLTASNLKFDEPYIKLKGGKGRLVVKLNSRFYEGIINMDGVIDVNTKGAPNLRTVASIKGVSLEGMATDLPVLKVVQGTVNADMNIHTNGQLKSVLTQNLNGTMSFGVDNGAFTKANFDKMVCDGIAAIRGKKIQKKDWGQSTQFKRLSGTFIIRNGVARNKDLTALLSSLNLKGDGNINLVEQTMDYHIGLNIRGDEALDSDPACEVNKDFIDVTWPVRCKGPLGMPRCGLDSERLSDTIASLAKKDVKSKIRKEIDKNIKGPLNNMLKGFFK